MLDKEDKIIKGEITEKLAEKEEVNANFKLVHGDIMSATQTNLLEHYMDQIEKEEPAEVTQGVPLMDEMD